MFLIELQFVVYEIEVDIKIAQNVDAQQSIERRGKHLRQRDGCD